MPDVLIKDVDPETIERLRKNAARQGRSLQQHLKRLLQREAGTALRESYEAAEWFAAQFREEPAPADPPEPEPEPEGAEEEPGVD
jgi:hypothetical protein